MKAERKKAREAIKQARIEKKKQIEKRLSQGGWKQRIAILTRRMMPAKRRLEIQRKNR